MRCACFEHHCYQTGWSALGVWVLSYFSEAQAPTRHILTSPHCAGLFLFSVVSMFMMHPAHVMGIEPFTHAHRYDRFFRMISAIPTAQHSRDDYQDR
jgi:hypothetical protein